MIDVTLRWYGQVASVENHIRQDLVADLRSAIESGGQGLVFGLLGRPGLTRVEGGRDADILKEGGGGLLVNIGLFRLPSQAAESIGFGSSVPHPVGSAANAISVAIVGVNPREDVGLGNGF